MANSKRFAMDLAKLVIAAAWADGEVQHEELNTLKHLMLSMPEMTGEDWRELELYLDHPVSEAEAQLLLENVLEDITSQDDKARVIEALTALVEADGVVTDEEAAMLATVREAVDARSTGLVGALSGLIGRAARALGRSGGHREVREARMAEYIGNPVYFRISPIRAEISAPDEVLRKACLVAGMMAKVACADDVIAPAEVAAIAARLEADWALSQKDAERLCQVGIERGLERLDVYRLGESLKACTDEDERRQLLATLFGIARADGLGDDEQLELRKITKCLGLRHRDFINAKTAGE